MTAGGLPDRLLIDGTILRPEGPDATSMLIREGRIAAFDVEPGDHDGEVIGLGGATVWPGFIDLHCHGGGGAAVYSGEPDDVVRAAALHAAHGTTSMMASLTALPPRELIEATRAIVSSVGSGRVRNIAGVHYEGPFLSPARPGAQPADGLRPVDAEELGGLLEVCGDLDVSMTIAPELEGAPELIERFRERVVFFVGHTDADAFAFDAAVDAGARAVTHLFNAMPPLHHRMPGPVARALLDERVTSELIVDGHHLDDDILRLALGVAGADRLMLATDAMAAAGMPDGDYDLPGLEASVRDGGAFVRGSDTLAGSTLTMDRAVERLVGSGAVGLREAARMASTNPAAVMGWADRGALRVGARADLVVIGPTGGVELVMVLGERVPPA